MGRVIILGRCESCGTTQIPLLRAVAKRDGEEHIFCPACWRRDWRPIDQYAADQMYEIHDEYKAESALPLPDDVLAAIGNVPVKSIRGTQRVPHPWTVACVTPGCTRTALYKTVSCNDHAPQRETPTL